jgi:putative FmdB family regulatory protein
MPIYEYRCSACGTQKDMLQKLSDPPATECPSCGKHALVKQVTAAGFQLKGSGWYATDFKNSGSRPVEKTEKKDAKAGETASGGTDQAASTAPASGASAAPASD